jgi:hypothetical protein
VSGSDVVAVREALRALDDERAPDLWPEITRRRDVGPATPEPARGRRLGPVLVAAALVVAIAVAAVVLRAGDDPADVDQPVGPVPPSPWVVTDRIEVRDLGEGARLLATAGDTTAIAARGGTALALVDQRAADLAPTLVPVPATAALAGDGDRVWLLATDGSLARVDDDGSVTTVARLGRSDDVDPMITASGGAVFVAGTDAGALVRVDPESGDVSTAPVGAPRAIAATDRWLWAVVDGGRRVVRIDPQTLEVATDVAADPVTAIAADGERSFVLHGDSGTLDRIDADGTTTSFTRVATSVSGIIVAGGELWATDGGVLTAYDLGSGESARPLALGRVRDQGLARGDDALWVVGPGVELLRIGPG